eukprot:CAMPEP_0196792018 /NCGR_PEP_ID=MMETSP1104-20130614/30724_1 /TAXON_ID=33652 /ORGANISM="Cafeteria sp., Strain Caron Lab Isolate" /LENGTH=67 /DNA_ID=CAMNT_0042162379 /DNA_START=45 /DNA_END=244 /DNA_ORIENTATION=+
MMNWKVYESAPIWLGGGRAGSFEGPEPGHRKPKQKDTHGRSNPSTWDALAQKRIGGIIMMTRTMAKA